MVAKPVKIYDAKSVEFRMNGVLLKGVYEPNFGTGYFRDV